MTETLAVTSCKTVVYADSSSSVSVDKIEYKIQMNPEPDIIHLHYNSIYDRLDLEPIEALWVRNFK